MFRESAFVAIMTTIGRQYTMTNLVTCPGTRRNRRLWCVGALVATMIGMSSTAWAARDPGAMPHLAPRHGATQLIVDGKPFLMRAGELENSSASSLSFLDKLWPGLEAMHLNTLIAPVSWNLVEPREGHFDFSNVDGLIEGARAHHMHLVLLWFGSWKNSMSSYVPGWVKRDADRFPRARRSDGTPMEMLSAFGDANLEADSATFVALMKHVKEQDAGRHTVLMVQVENEVGMIPEARDHGALADAAFRAPVPTALTDWLSRHEDTLALALQGAWQARGSRVGADWKATFGAGIRTDELFTAWTESLYTGTVAARGKAVYPLPMYVNAALVRPGRKPGQYPSGGPLPHLFDIWHAAAPAIDFLAPDIYFPNFREWAEKYAHPGAPFFIPETGRVSGAQMGVNALYAYAQLDAMGVSPYAPEFLSAADAKALGQAYGIVAQMTPLILANQGTGNMVGVLPPTRFDGHVDLDPQTLVFGDYAMTIDFRRPDTMPKGDDVPVAHGGLVIRTGPDDFWFAGTGMTVYFGLRGHAGGRAGIDAIWAGRFVQGRWVRGRQINGDDDNQGRYLHLPDDRFVIRHVKLYRYH